MTVKQQAALMRLGLRYIEENACQNMWVGRLPTREEVDQWERTAIEMRRIYEQPTSTGTEA